MTFTHEGQGPRTGPGLRSLVRRTGDDSGCQRCQRGLPFPPVPVTDPCGVETSEEGEPTPSIVREPNEPGSRPANRDPHAQTGGGSFPQPINSTNRPRAGPPGGSGREQASREWPAKGGANRIAPCLRVWRSRLGCRRGDTSRVSRGERDEWAAGGRAAVRARPRRRNLSLRRLERGRG